MWTALFTVVLVIAFTPSSLIALAMIMNTPTIMV